MIDKDRIKEIQDMVIELRDSDGKTFRIDHLYQNVKMANPTPQL